MKLNARFYIYIAVAAFYAGYGKWLWAVLWLVLALAVQIFPNGFNLIKGRK